MASTSAPAATSFHGKEPEAGSREVSMTAEVAGAEKARAMIPSLRGRLSASLGLTGNTASISESKFSRCMIFGIPDVWIGDIRCAAACS